MTCIIATSNMVGQLCVQAIHVHNQCTCTHKSLGHIVRYGPNKLTMDTDISMRGMYCLILYYECWLD